jgi:predicted amino acid racemase
MRGVVAVEPQEVRSLTRYGIRIAHVGHLVNIPENEIDFVLKIVKPEVVTVFNYEKAKMISDHAKRLGLKQKILIRAIGPNDICFPYMEGGILEKHVTNVIKKINTLPNVAVEGITSFPCLLYDIEAGKPVYTPNIETIGRVVEKARSQGLQFKQINTPPFCITKTIKFYADKGSTHCEPGMGVSGMSIWHCMAPQIHPEIPAGLYVTEISHFVDEFAYVYGGGFTYIEIYELARRGKVYTPALSKLKMKALVNRKPNEILHSAVEAEHYRGILDYHAKLYRNDHIKIGDTVLYGFRTQMFVTRAQTAVVAGLRENNPKLIGIFDQGNNLIDRFGHLLGEKKVSELIERHSK